MSLLRPTAPPPHARALVRFPINPLPLTSATTSLSGFLMTSGWKKATVLRTRPPSRAGGGGAAAAFFVDLGADGGRAGSAGGGAGGEAAAAGGSGPAAAAGGGEGAAAAWGGGGASGRAGGASIATKSDFRVSEEKQNALSILRVPRHRALSPTRTRACVCVCVCVCVLPLPTQHTVPPNTSTQMADRGKKPVGVANVQRRTWDTSEYEAAAEERKQEV